MKRLFGIVFSVLGLTTISPVLILFSLIVILGSCGEVFLREVEIGQYREDFKIFKSRSMMKDTGGRDKWDAGDNDRWITRLGHFPRRSKLDELP